MPSRIIGPARSYNGLASNFLAKRLLSMNPRIFFLGVREYILRGSPSLVKTEEKIRFLVFKNKP